MTVVEGHGPVEVVEGSGEVAGPALRRGPSEMLLEAIAIRAAGLGLVNRGERRVVFDVDSDRRQHHFRSGSTRTVNHRLEIRFEM